MSFLTKGDFFMKPYNPKSALCLFLLDYIVNQCVFKIPFNLFDKYKKPSLNNNIISNAENIQ